MGESSNLKIFCFLCCVEGIISLVNGFINHFCFVDPNEPHPVHQTVFFFAYFMFFFLSVIQVLKMETQGTVRLKFEAIASSCGFTFYIITSVVSMVDAENDTHLWDMTDQEEFLHPFFQCNRNQSVLSLVNALVYLIHSLFVLDLILWPPVDDLSITTEYDDEDNLVDNSLQLKFFFKNIWLAIKPM